MELARTAGDLRRARRVAGRRDRVPPPGRAGDRDPGAGQDDRARVRRPRPAGRQRDRRLDRRHPGDGRRARPVPRPGLQGHPPRRARATGSTRAPGIILRTEKSVLFVIPWGRHWIIGTTDTHWDLDKAHPAATSADIEYLLEHVNRFLTTPLTQADVEGVYAGLRPLLAGESEQTSKLSREHVVAHPTPGLIVVAGGKYTTYRIMARDAIDEAARTLGGSVPESTTQDIPLRRRRGLPRHVEPAGRAGRGVRSARRADREDADAARHPHHRDPRPHRGGPLARRPAARRRGLPARRDRLRRVARGRPAPRRRPGPADPAVHRDLGPRRRRLAPGRRDRRADPRLGRRHRRQRGRALPPAGRGGAHVADDAGRRGGRPCARLRAPDING